MSSKKFDDEQDLMSYLESLMQSKELTLEEIDFHECEEHEITLQAHKDIEEAKKMPIESFVSL